ncbi:hypothetical protein PHLGIDRAFT_23195 [Phlebiopsis gigantea 11061_1 CR5-6]|uniref:Uncharacterized protein n=1 Tax=Phlebiopsis gigantea (strain 11061_1 CR5-6) TaxID=745531 RepID=A0A0C3SAB0_PHLG1|nr:hypothetical protein PHLGIDRAFT_23195 [Phlebiopsis gigantea 11061_1 CR5-6]
MADNHSVLVTGASRGVGKATAIALAQAGVSGLVLFARSDLSAVKDACLASQRGGQSLRVLTFTVDIADNEQVVAAVNKAGEALGRLDIVINNAAQVADYKLIADSDAQDWWSIWDINLRGTYHVVRAVLPLLIKSGGDKTIVNVGSLAAVFILPTLSSYSTSKIALLRFTEFINTEYGDKGVLAYTIHPGSIPTDMAASIPDEFKDRLVDTVELPAHTLVWLIKERRDWLAGRFISCNWDVEEFLGKKDEVVKGDKLKARVVF